MSPQRPDDSTTGPNGRRKHRRVVRLGVGDPVMFARSADDGDVGWHEKAGDSTNDERLRRDVPPHW